MNVLITYDLQDPTRDYSSLYEEIKKAGNWWHHIDSVWIVKSDVPPKALGERLLKHLDPKDYLLVTEIKSNTWGNLPKEAFTWLEKNLNDRRVGKGAVLG